MTAHSHDLHLSAARCFRALTSLVLVAMIGCATVNIVEWEPVIRTGYIHWTDANGSPQPVPPPVGKQYEYVAGYEPRSTTCANVVAAQRKMFSEADAYLTTLRHVFDATLGPTYGGTVVPAPVDRMIPPRGLPFAPGHDPANDWSARLLTSPTLSGPGGTTPPTVGSDDGSAPGDLPAPPGQAPTQLRCEPTSDPRWPTATADEKREIIRACKAR